MSTPPREASDVDWIVPRRDWKLGQTDKTTAGCLRTMLLAVA